MSSPNVVPECPACRITMAPGFVLDKAHGTQTEPMSWIEGEPEKRRLGGFATKGRTSHRLVAFRCPRCAWVIWFAPEVAAP